MLLLEVGSFSRWQCYSWQRYMHSAECLLVCRLSSHWVNLMSETSMNQSMTTMTTLHTVIMKDAICSDYNINAHCDTFSAGNWYYACTELYHESKKHSPPYLCYIFIDFQDLSLTHSSANFVKGAITSQTCCYTTLWNIHIQSWSHTEDNVMTNVDEPVQNRENQPHSQCSINHIS